MSFTTNLVFSTHLFLKQKGGVNFKQFPLDASEYEDDDLGPILNADVTLFKL